MIKKRLLMLPGMTMKNALKFARWCDINKGKKVTFQCKDGILETTL